MQQELTELRHNARRYREITKPTESGLKMDDSVAAPRILNMAAQFLKRGHNVDQLSTIGSVFVKNSPQDKQSIQNVHYHCSEIIPTVPTPSSFTSCVQNDVKVHYTISRNLPHLIYDFA